LGLHAQPVDAAKKMNNPKAWKKPYCKAITVYFKEQPRHVNVLPNTIVPEVGHACVE